MGAVSTQALPLDTFRDFSQSYTWLGSNLQPTDLTGATAALMVKRTAADATPLIGVSTTPNTDGSIILNDGGGALSGTASVTNNSTAIAFSTAQSLAAGAWLRLDSQSSVLYQLAAAVTGTTGTLTTAYTGTTAGTANVSVITGIVTVNITHVATAALDGIATALYDLAVTFSNGQVLTFLAGQVVATQSITH